MDEDRAAAAARTAKVAAGLCVMSLAVLMLVLMIDNMIKRRLMADVAEARKIVDTFTIRARGWSNGTEAAEPGRTDPVSRGDSGDDVGGDPPAGPAVAETESRVDFPPRADTASRKGRPLRDG